MKKKSILFICLLSFIYGCAILGSKARVYNAKDLSTIKNVAILLTSKGQNIPDEVNSMLDSAFITTIKNRFTGNTYFEVHFPANIETADITFEKRKFNTSNPDAFKNYDAVIIFNRKLIPPMGMYADSKVEISIYNIKTGDQIMYVSHNTDLGNSYWKNPELPGTLVDATNGAIDKLFEKMHKSNRTH